MESVGECKVREFYIAISVAFQHFKHSLLSFCGRWCVRKQATNWSGMSEVFIVLH